MKTREDCVSRHKNDSDISKDLFALLQPHWQVPLKPLAGPLGMVT